MKRQRPTTSKSKALDAPDVPNFFSKGLLLGLGALAVASLGGIVYFYFRKQNYKSNDVEAMKIHDKALELSKSSEGKRRLKDILRLCDDAYKISPKSGYLRSKGPETIIVLFFHDFLISARFCRTLGGNSAEAVVIAKAAIAAGDKSSKTYWELGMVLSSIKFGCSSFSPFSATNTTMSMTRRQNT